MEFRAKKLTRDREGHYIKRSIQQEDITILNVYVSNNRVYKCKANTDSTEQKLMGGEIDKSTIVFGGFNTLSQLLIKQIERKSVGIQKNQ